MRLNSDQLNNIGAGLAKHGYFASPLLVAQLGATLTTRPTAGAFLFGPAGSGKTFLAESAAKVLGDITGQPITYLFQQVFPGTREDDLLMKAVPSQSTVSGVTLIPGVMLEAFYALQKSPDGYVVVCLDEYDKSRPSADAVPLDYLQYHRVRYAGSQEQLTPAQAERLVVFITLNDERTLSEPLLRRLPKIDFMPMPVALVRKALELSHPKHPLTEAALKLYARATVSGMAKPCTVQELRQLLTAAQGFGESLGWNNLVYQFITKSPENHNLLKEAEDLSVAAVETELKKAVMLNAELTSSKYDGAAIDESRLGQTISLLPTLTAVAGRSKFTRPIEKSPHLEADDTMVIYNDEQFINYTEAALSAQGPVTDPTRLGSARVYEDAIVWKGRAFDLGQPDVQQKIRSFANRLAKGTTGEVLLRGPSVTLADMRLWIGLHFVAQNSPLRTTSWTDTEIMGTGIGFTFHWTQAQGLEAIADLAGIRDGERIPVDLLGTAAESLYGLDGTSGIVRMRELKRPNLKVPKAILVRHMMGRTYKVRIAALTQVTRANEGQYEFDQMWECIYSIGLPVNSGMSVLDSKNGIDGGTLINGSPLRSISLTQNTAKTHRFTTGMKAYGLTPEAARQAAFMMARHVLASLWYQGRAAQRRQRADSQAEAETGEEPE